MTIKDIARETGYSVSTVSRALNDHPDINAETKARIAAVVRANHYVPNSNARQLKQQQTNNILILVKGAFNLFFANILEQMQTIISQNGYTAVIHYTGEDDNEVVAAWQISQARKPLGIIFLGGNESNFQKDFGSFSVPCVLATNTLHDVRLENLSSVGVDDRDAACQAVRYLLGRGHTEIGVIGGEAAVSEISRRRLLGCQQAFAESGMHLPTKLYQAVQYNPESGHTAMKRLLAQNENLSAVFCMSDLLAMGAMRAVADAGLRVPQDVSVVGFDGLPLCSFLTPRLASMSQPQSKIARETVRLLLEQIEQQAPARHILLKAQLVRGESVVDNKP